MKKTRGKSLLEYPSTKYLNYSCYARLLGSNINPLASRPAGDEYKFIEYGPETMAEFIKLSKEGNIDEARKFLCEHQEIIKFKDSFGINFLMFAIYYKNEYGHLIELLLEPKGIDPFDVCSVSYNSLMFAVIRGYTDIVDMILAREKNIQSGDEELIKKLSSGNQFGENLLIIAADHRRTEIIERLLEYNIDINQFDQNGYGPLMIAVEKNYPEIVSLFLSRDDIEINAENATGKDTFDIALERNYFGYLKQMLLHKNFIFKISQENMGQYLIDRLDMRNGALARPDDFCDLLIIYVGSLQSNHHRQSFLDRIYAKSNQTLGNNSGLILDENNQIQINPDAENANHFTFSGLFAAIETLHSQLRLRSFLMGTMQEKRNRSIVQTLPIDVLGIISKETLPRTISDYIPADFQEGITSKILTGLTEGKKLSFPSNDFEMPDANPQNSSGLALQEESQENEVYHGWE